MATTEVAKSLIAQLDSQSKLATPRRENKTKFDMYSKHHFKSKRTRSVCVGGASDLLNDTKIYTTKSRETIPLTHH
jgi:hypothetical protein